MDVAITGWAVTIGLVGALLALDLGLSSRRPHAVGFREATAWSLFYIAVAVGFGIALGFIAGWGPGAEYFAGYIVEKSLSIDNLFVFVIIMSSFAVPIEHQQKVLTIGILAALALRAVFIALGAALLADSATRVDSVVLIDVLAMGIGIGLPGGRMATVLQRNSRLPAKKAYEHATTRDGQTELELQVFQGDSAKVAECEYLGTLKVGGLPSRPRGEVRVAVEFSVGNEGILDITARDLSTGKVTEVRFATADTPEALRQKLQLTEPQTAPRGSRPIEAPKGDDRKGIFGRIFGAKK